MKKKNTEEFIADARKVHGDKYDYSKVEYKSNKEKVCIICPIHGEFWQKPNSHLSGAGCSKCKGGVTLTTEEFIERAKKVHGNKYDYSKVKYVDTKTKVCIICPIHGEFWQKPNDHLSGCECKFCKINVYDKISFINISRKIHGDKYDYSKVEYKDSKTKVCIICPIHGEFWQTPNSHVRGQNCPLCSHPSKKKSTEEFIEEAKKIHGDKYDYSKTEYIDSKTEVCIICPIHGEFWQKPGNHLKYNGCPKCNSSHLETEVQKILNDNNIEYEYNKRYDYLDTLQLDFLIKNKNIAIECQGEQHFMPVKHFGGDSHYQITLERDNRKRKLCEENGIKLLYYSNLHIDYPYKVYENLDEILQIIKEC